MRDTFLVNGVVVDALGGYIDHGYVRMRDETIVAVASGKPANIPYDAQTIDVGGACILPGLINLHTHAQRRHLHRQTSNTPIRIGGPALEAQSDETRLMWAIKNSWAELAEGVTTVRDTGAGNALTNKLRWAFATGMFGGPRVVSCGAGISMTGGHLSRNGSEVADGPTGVQRAVRHQLDLGADWIKLMASAGIGGMPDYEDPRFAEYTQEEMAAGVREAHARNARVCSHAYFPEAIQNAVRAGVDCIEHGAALDEESVRLMALHGTFYVPTMTGLIEVRDREAASGDPQTAALMTSVVIEPHRESVKLAYAAGIRIGIGTDTLGSVVKEIQLLHELGIPAMECIRAGTNRAAEVLGMHTEIGALAEGYGADVIVVEGNPLDDLAALRRVVHVFKSGYRVDAAFMAGSVEESIAAIQLNPVRSLYRRPAESQS